MLTLPGTRVRLRSCSYNFHWWVDFGFILNGFSLMLKDQTIYEMREFETRIKFYEDRARILCRYLKRNILHCPKTVSSQHPLFLAPEEERSWLQYRRGHHINETLSHLSLLSDFYDSYSSFITWSSPPLVLSFIQAPLYTANSLGIFVLNHHAFHWMIRKTKQGSLKLLCSQILISRWFVLPSALVCENRRGSKKLSSFVCLEPNKELTCLAQYLLRSVRYVRGTINFMVL